jgi:hypothetical protein
LIIILQTGSPAKPIHHRDKTAIRIQPGQFSGRVKFREFSGDSSCLLACGITDGRYATASSTKFAQNNLQLHFSIAT